MVDNVPGVFVRRFHCAWATAIQCVELELILGHVSSRSRRRTRSRGRLLRNDEDHSRLEAAAAAVAMSDISGA